MINILYNDLKTLISDNQLVPEEQYCITDYVTTVAKVNYTSAGYKFDIVVTALDTNTLYEYALLTANATEIYFDADSLLIYNIRYNVNNIIPGYDNDWVDANGKGCIYYMVDNKGNECPYDFKNIKYNGKFLFNNTLDGTDASQTVSEYNVVREVIEDGYFKLPQVSFNDECSNVNIGTNASEVTITESSNLQIGDNCKNSEFTNVNNTLIGNELSGATLTSIDGVEFGDNNNGIIATNHTNLIIKDKNTSVTLGGGGNGVIIDSNNANITIGTNAKDVYINASKEIILGHNVEQFNISLTYDVVVEDDCKLFNLNETNHLTATSGCENIHTIKNDYLTLTEEVKNVTVSEGLTNLILDGTKLTGSDGKLIIKQDEKVVVINEQTNSELILTEDGTTASNPNSYITDSPADGLIYGRKDGDWEEIDISGITDAYTKTESDEKYETIANVDLLEEQILTNTEDIEYLQSNKANTLHTHTKSEVGLSNVDNTSDLTKPISTATQTALDLKASQSDIDTAINAIEVGGRNLIPNTKDLTGYPYRTSDTYLGFNIARTTRGATGYLDTFATITPDIAVGSTYVASFYAKASVNTPMNCHWYSPNTTTSALTSTGYASTSADGGATIVVTTEWKKYWVVWTQTLTELPKRLIIGRNATIAGAVLEIAGVKLEKGNKATDWTPAPEDINEDISDLQTALNSKANTLHTHDANVITSGDLSLDRLSNMKKYVASRGENLVTNGTGLLKDNTNFSRMTYTGEDSYNCDGSFTTASGSWMLTDESMPVNPDLSYRLLYYIKAKPWVDSGVLAGVACFDTDGLEILPHMTMYVTNTLTTLSEDLKDGDTTVKFTNLTNNWVNVASVGTHTRTLIFWNYVDSYGKSYPELTYSRNAFQNSWDPGAVNYTTNTITLNKPWSNGTIVAGTKVSNGNSGGTYKYLATYNYKPTAEWTVQSDIISGIDHSGGNYAKSFHPGTASIRLVFGLNRNVTGGQHYISNISFGIETHPDAVLYDSIQSLSNTQKTQARTNIGAGTSSFSGVYDDLSNKPTIPTVPSDVLRYGTQTLTTTQKTQARTNIGAGTSSFSGSYNDLSNKPNIIPEAPSDNKTYGRKNSAWSEIDTSGGGEYEKIKTITSTTSIVLDKQYKIYKYIHSSGNITSFSFSTTLISDLGSGEAYTFEMEIQMPSNGISITFPSTIVPLNGTTITLEAGKKNLLAFRTFDGTNWICNYQGYY